MGGSDYSYDPKASKSGGDSDKIFQSSTDEVERTVSDSGKKNVFISFDVDDEGQVALLRTQAKDDRFPFDFRDYSVKEPFDSKWKSEVKNLLSLTSKVVVMIGPNTAKSEAVNWEIDEAHRQNKKVIGVRIYRHEDHDIPPAMKTHHDHIMNWDTKELSDRISEK